MNKQTHWRYWLVAVVIAVGLIIAFWPHALTDPSTEVSIGNGAADNESDDSSIASGATEQEKGEDTNIEIPTDPGAAENGALLNQQAMNAWHAGEIREAMALFEQAIEAAPDDPAPHSNYGRLLTLMVSYQQALPLLERARDLRPDDAQMWLDLATLYERAQILEKSWEARARAAELVGSEAITRDRQGRFVVQGNSL